MTMIQYNSTHLDLGETFVKILKMRKQCGRTVENI